MGSWTHRPGWPIGVPGPETREFPRRAAAWISARVLPPALGHAVPLLHVYPQAAGRVAWYVLRAPEEVIRLADVLPQACLDGQLPAEAVEVLRTVELHAEDRGEGIPERLGELEVVGPHLPRHVITGWR